MATPILDKSRDFGTVHGGSRAAFMQDGEYFTNQGVHMTPGEAATDPHKDLQAMTPAEQADEVHRIELERKAKLASDGKPAAATSPADTAAPQITAETKVGHKAKAPRIAEMSDEQLEQELARRAEDKLGPQFPPREEQPVSPELEEAIKAGVKPIDGADEVPQIGAKTTSTTVEDPAERREFLSKRPPAELAKLIRDIKNANEGEELTDKQSEDLAEHPKKGKDSKKANVEFLLRWMR